MSRFCLILTHYLKRSFADAKELVLILAIPLGLIIFMILIGGEVQGIYLNGYHVLGSHAAPAMLLSFQFFNSAFMFLYLYADFRSDRRWRLLASPCPVRTFVFPAFIANWILSVGIGIAIIIIAALFMNIYWSNIFVLLTVLALVSLIATFTAVLIFLFTKRITQANAVGYIIAFGLMILSGFMVPLGLFGDNIIVRFLTNYGTPLSLGTAAVISSGSLYGIFPEDINIVFAGVGIGGGMQRALINIGILAAMALILGLFTAIVARRRKI